MESALDKLPYWHVEALRWFEANAGRTFAKRPFDVGLSIKVTSQQKGIWKPSRTPFAVSVVQTHRGVYPDQDPVMFSDGTWVYSYHQQGSTADDLRDPNRHFANTALALVLSAPRAEADDDEGAWAAQFCRARGAEHVQLPELVRPAAGESDEDLAARAWPALEHTLGGGHARILAVLCRDVLRVSAACALGIPLARAAALRVDPGRLVLLRDEPIGLVLRRSNVLVPQEGSGTALPTGRTAPSRAGEERAR
jgi:hypothetical protein